jgi:Swt1-like HEPN
LRVSIAEFAFRGLIAKQAVRDMRARGLLRAPASTPDEVREHDFYAPVPETIRTGSRDMQRNYRMLFVFENLLREFISQRFSEVDGDGWFDSRATAPMKQTVADRKEKEQRNQWHMGRNEHPIFYLDFSHLGLLMTNHWAIFRDFFENQVWVQSRLQEVERTRNVIAHTNVLASEESERLEMYLRDWMRQVS